MQYLCGAAFVWAIIYLMLGYVTGFAGMIRGTDLVFFLEIFVAPLPIAVVSFLRPTLAGMLLLLCLAAGVLATAYVAFEHRGTSPGEAPRWFASIGAYNLPHLIFGLLFLRTSAPHCCRASKKQLRAVS